jgi:hypothetical protein
VTGFTITDAHLKQVAAWVSWMRHRYGDLVDWEQFGNWALYRAWLTYRNYPAKSPRTHFHLKRALGFERCNALRHRKRQLPTNPELVADFIDGRFCYRAAS